MVKRKVIFRDSARLLILILATVVLYVATSFLFRAFEARRVELGKQYAARGNAALSAGHPEQAIAALRVAQTYAPDTRTNHLLLAEALAQAGHTDEAVNYFLSLRESEPADGFINLQLARLARKQDETGKAIDYYRDSSLGNWQGDGITLRRQVQLELSDYLIQHGQLAAARAEILVAANNSPETTGLDKLFGDLLLRAADPSDALTYYKKAINLDSHDLSALTSAGRVAYSLGDYDTAAKLLTQASTQEVGMPHDRPAEKEVATFLADSKRILELTLSRNQPAEERTEHIEEAAAIAKRRFDDCAAKFTGAGQQNATDQQTNTKVELPDELLPLKAEWQTAATVLSRRSLLQNTANQDNLEQLVFNTELQTEPLCGTPTGDDALLLLLAKSQH